MASKSKFFRVFVEGDTVDGRVIQRKWIEQMAKSYDPQKYGARIWLEHIRGILPDSPFKAYGDVTAVKAEEVTIDGKNKLALFAQIDATPELVAINKARQKIYTSAEIDPDFAKSGECYFMGLGITDSPASLGTEMLTFAANSSTNPLAGRKQSPGNFFTAAHEVALEFEEEKPEAKPDAGETLFSKVKDLLGIGKKDADDRFADQGKAIEFIAQSQKEALDSIDKFSKSLDAKIDATAALLKETQEKLAAFKAQMENTPDGTAPRPKATGGDGQITTDC